MKNTFIIVVLLFFVGAMADNFNITSVNINNTACGSTLYPGGHIDVIWQTSNQTAAGQASCYVSVRRAANVSEILLGNQIGSQAPCNQGFLSINITSSPMNLTAWNHLRVIAMVNEVAPSSGHNDSCSFVIMDPPPQICPYYPCKVALIGTFVPVGILTIIACCACHRCWWMPKKVRDGSRKQENGQSYGENIAPESLFPTTKDDSHVLNLN